jgi:hypothetical protein
MEYFQPAIENRMKIPRKADPAAKNQTENPSAEAEKKKSHSETDQLTNRSSTRRAQEFAGERRDYKARRSLALSGRGS